jgi:hypothetical protein
MTQLTVAPAFPEPYLQPDRNQDCGFYTAAYIAHCLGHPEVTAAQVKAWRAETRRHEDHYAAGALAAEARTFWDELTDKTASMADSLKHGKFWMGPGTAEWVRSWLAGGWIAHVEVMRIPAMGHAVALLDASDDGVLLMDPIHGHVIEPWNWFLGAGPGMPGAHHIAAWYRAAPSTLKGGPRW